MNNRVMQSYVWYEGKCFSVSTINRRSSAMMNSPSEYAETMVWYYDYEKRECGAQVFQDEDAKDGILTHINVCKRLHATGNPEVV
ncbi:MAG: hypothetical protein PHX83_11890 [Acidobacteriia bacterium]|nr:hypothetical protein [Terriglobia bacterium]